MTDHVKFGDALQEYAPALAEVIGLDPHEQHRMQAIVLRPVASRGAIRVSQNGTSWVGPRRAQRQAEYLKRRALLGTDDGRNPMVDMCRVLAGMSAVRRANRAKAGSSAAGRARGAGRGQTPPMTRAARLDNYWAQNGRHLVTERQGRQLNRMAGRNEPNTYSGSTHRLFGKDHATPRRPR